MEMNLKWLGAALLWLGAASTACAGGELEERDAIIHQVRDSFFAERFAELDRLAEKMRSDDERTPSGLWRLTMFYFGIKDFAESHSRAPEYWSSIEEKAHRWALSAPDSPTPHLVEAMVLVGHGRALRGYSRAPSSREAGEQFLAYLKRAEEILRQHKAIADRDPRWYESMLGIARDAGWKRPAFDALVEEGVERHPFYYPIYFAAMEYLEPRWHGNPAEMEKFADFAVSKTRTREGDGLYARLYWSVAQSPSIGVLLMSDTNVDWTKMKRGIDDVLARYPDQWNINNFANFACLARDRTKTKELMARIDGTPIPAAWFFSESRIARCELWSQAGDKWMSEPEI